MTYGSGYQPPISRSESIPFSPIPTQPRGPNFDFDADRIAREAATAQSEAPTESIQDHLFATVDAESKAFIRVIGDNLAQAQKNDVEPTRLKKIIAGFMDNINRTLDASQANKTAFLEKTGQPAAEPLSEAARAQLVIDILAANQSERERELEARIKAYRESLGSQAPQHLAAFNAYFPTFEAPVSLGQPVHRVSTEELQAIVNPTGEIDTHTNTNPNIFPGEDLARTALIGATTRPE